MVAKSLRRRFARWALATGLALAAVAGRSRTRLFAEPTARPAGAFTLGLIATARSFAVRGARAVVAAARGAQLRLGPSHVPNWSVPNRRVALCGFAAWTVTSRGLATGRLAAFPGHSGGGNGRIAIALPPTHGTPRHAERVIGDIRLVADLGSVWSGDPARRLRAFRRIAARSPFAAPFTRPLTGPIAPAGSARLARARLGPAANRSPASAPLARPAVRQRGLVRRLADPLGILAGQL